MILEKINGWICFSDHVENFYSLKRTKAFRWFGTRIRHFLGQDYSFTSKNNAMCRQIHMNN
jgi:hypothetical protein